MTVEALFERALMNWRNHKATGYEIVPPPIDDKYLLYTLLCKVYNKNEHLKTLIIVETFDVRCKLIDFLTKQNNENDKEFKNLIKTKELMIYTSNIIMKMITPCVGTLSIIYNLSSVDDFCISRLSYAKWHYILLNKTLDNESMKRINAFSKALNSITQTDIDTLRTSFPVEEFRVGVALSPDSVESINLKRYDDFIATSMNIFGSFDVMKTAMYGDNKISMSAAMVCEQLAKENGWNEHLDMSIDFNKQLDAVYNPNSIRERANLTYTYIRDRNQLLSDASVKYDAIFDIIRNNPDAKILIINKRPSFATQLSEVINQEFGNISMPHHKSLETIPATDDDGNPVCYATGPRKGERKIYGCVTRCNMARDKFNDGKIRVLCVNNAPDVNLNIHVDVVIITSPQCDNISNYFYRLSYCQFNVQGIKLYSLYIKNSVEEIKLKNKVIGENHIISEDIENEINIENNYDFIIAY